MLTSFKHQQNIKMSNLYLILFLLLGLAKTQTCQYADECGNFVYECCSCPYAPGLTCSQKSSRYCGTNPCPNSTGTTTTETPKAQTAWWVYLLIALGCMVCTCFCIWGICVSYKHHTRVRTGKEAERFQKEMESRQQLEEKKRVYKQEKRKSDRQLEKKIYEQRQVERKKAKEHNERVRADAQRLYPIPSNVYDHTELNNKRQEYIDRNSIDTGCQIF